MKYSIVLALSACVFVSACTKEDVAQSPKFDAKTIAAEADKGNLGPLKDLNAACAVEVEKTGKRAEACRSQDEVGALRKPLKLSF